MTAVFLKLLNMSLTAGVLALVVMLFRAVFRKAPKWVNVALWGLVALRLLVPFSVQSPASLLPSAAPVAVQPVVRTAAPDTRQLQVQTGVRVIDQPLNSILEAAVVAPVEEENQKPALSLPQILSAVWGCGLALMLIYALFSVLRLHRKLGAVLLLETGVYLSDEIGSPFILGVLRPRIYLPSSLNEAQRKTVLRHERAHLRRRDHWWKPLGFLLLSVYWFNPVLWVAYALLCRDIELACDEKVIRDLDREQRAAYTQTLLDCRHPRAAISACPVAFGELGVKTRVKQVLNYKKPAFWVIAAALITSAVLAVCFLTDPKRKAEASPDLETAISAALKGEVTLDPFAEFAAEGHVTLGVEETNDGVSETAKVYALTETCAFGFQNGWFLEQSGSVCPAVLTFEKLPLLENGEKSYVLKTIDYPKDGALLAPSVKKLFPRACRSRALEIPDADKIDMWTQCKAQAQQYLSRLGRADTPVGAYGDIGHILLTDRGMTNGTWGKVCAYGLLYDLDEIGWRESFDRKKGVRFVYRTAVLSDSETLLLTKEVYGTDEVKELILIGIHSGDILYNSTEVGARDLDLHCFSGTMVQAQSADSSYRLVMPLDELHQGYWSDGIYVQTETLTPQATNAAAGEYVTIYFSYPVAESRPERMPCVYAICYMGDVYELGEAAAPGEQVSNGAYYVTRGTSS